MVLRTVVTEIKHLQPSPNSRMPRLIVDSRKSHFSGASKATRFPRSAFGSYLKLRALLVAAPITAKAIPATKQKTAP